MTNLPLLPAWSVVSATIAAITAPTKPTPITTTISLPSARAALTRDFDPLKLRLVVLLARYGELLAGGTD